MKFFTNKLFTIFLLIQILHFEEVKPAENNNNTNE